MSASLRKRTYGLGDAPPSLKPRSLYDDHTSYSIATAWAERPRANAITRRRPHSRSRLPHDRREGSHDIARDIAIGVREFIRYACRDVTPTSRCCRLRGAQGREISE